MTMKFSQRRTQNRFNLSVDAQLSTPQNPEPLNSRWNASYTTKNICSGGAFLLTDRPPRVGTQVNLTFKLSFPGNENGPQQSVVSVSGTVLRVEPNGIALRFDKKFQITPNGRM